MDRQRMPLRASQDETSGGGQYGVFRMALVLAALTAGRLWIAAVVPLAPDEAYYWIWSRALAPGYLDHPPMVALWIWLGTALAGPGYLGVRLLGPFSAALGSILIYDATERLFPGRRAGLTAAVLLNATLFMSVGAVIMTPDTPLMFFWTGALWAGARIASGGSPRWWLAAGAFSGLALTSKYTAAFLPLGFALFALIAMPRVLRGWHPWAGAGAAVVMFLPVVLWNAANNWAGFARQGGRVADWRHERAASFLAELVGSQLGLATPGVFILCVAGVVWAARRTFRTRDPGWTLLAALSVPPALMFLQHAIGDRVQGNWPAILYPAAIMAAAGLVAAQTNKTKPGDDQAGQTDRDGRQDRAPPFAEPSAGLIQAGRVWRRMAGPSVVLGFAIATLVYAHAVTGWPAVAGGRDPAARQLFGWNDLAAKVEAARLAAGAGFVAAEPFGLAAELAWALPRGTMVVAAGRHWASFNLPGLGQRGGHEGGGQGIFLRPARYAGPPAASDWRDPMAMEGVSRDHGGVEMERYAIFLGRAAISEGAPVVVLPRP